MICKLGFFDVSKELIIFRRRRRRRRKREPKKALRNGNEKKTIKIKIA
jgi:hypothetical protein